jgi:hypothetical protein
VSFILNELEERGGEERTEKKRREYRLTDVETGEYKRTG